MNPATQLGNGRGTDPLAAHAIAPPVVAVMVVHDPGEWFAETLASVAAQDYANIRTLFMLSGDTAAAADQIREAIPQAYIRQLEGDPGFGESANEVLALVEGDNGFFLILHDDVVLERATVRQLVEELYRSNAGAVGPKLVEWNDRRILQRVGLGVDPYGEIDTFLQPGEADQEQHDAVSDVFALPSACILIRADLFRALDGFAPNIRFHGDDVELCWRAHLGGARTVVAPQARVRHIGNIAARRPDLDHTAMAERNRITTVATLTGGRRLPLVMLRNLVFTLGQLVVGVFSGTVGRAFAALRSTVGLVPRLGAIIARRRQVRAFRRVPDRDVADMQLRGSARLAAYLRSRGSMPADPDASVERRWRQTAGTAPAVFWLVAITALVVGSRKLLSGGVPVVGQFLPFPDSPGDLFAQFRSGWWDHGLGSSAPAPTGAALVAVGSTLALFHMGLWHTVCVLGLVVLGMLGMWRLGRLFPTARARIVGVAAYALAPLSAGLLSRGRWAALACLAAMPWVVHLLRRAAGLEQWDAPDEVYEAWVRPPVRRHIRLAAALALVVAVPAAFTPVFLPVVLIAAVAMALSGWLAGSTWQAGVSLVAHAAAAVLVAFVLLLPWASTWFATGTWTALVGVPPAGAAGLGLFRLASLGIGTVRFAIVAIALYLPLFGALGLARSWRFLWAARSAALVVVFLALAVAADRNALGFDPPEAGILLVPVALGLALGAACFVAALSDDVLVGGFGWRQPVGLLCSAGLVAGLVPGAITVLDGRWNMPRSSIETVTEQLPDQAVTRDNAGGDYRVLWVGDDRLIPVGSWAFAPGVAFGLSNGPTLSVVDSWPAAPTAPERGVGDALQAIANGTTFRAGRLLAIYGIRYVVIPLGDRTVDGATSAVPVGLFDALDDQLDLSKPPLGPVDYLVYENAAWAPARAVLNEAGAAASTSDDWAVLAATDLTSSTPFAADAPTRGPATAPVPAGVVHVAAPLDADWTMRVGDQTVLPRTTVGGTAAFDVPAGTATLQYHTPVSRTLLVVMQMVLWAVVLLAATRADPVAWYRRRRARSAPTAQPVLAIDDEDYAMPAWHSGQPLDDVWGDDGVEGDE